MFKIGNLEFKNNVIIAPMAGVSNICLPYHNERVWCGAYLC